MSFVNTCCYCLFTDNHILRNQSFCWDGPLNSLAGIEGLRCAMMYYAHDTSLLVDYARTNMSRSRKYLLKYNHESLKDALKAKKNIIPHGCVKCTV